MTREIVSKLTIRWKKKGPDTSRLAAWEWIGELMAAYWSTPT
jgi:hypothetical protein